MFLFNHAVDEGGALYALNSSPVIEACTFTSNTAVAKGGAISAPFCPLVTITSICTFDSNQAAAYGGAISADGSSIQVENSTFTANTGTDRGGAIFSWNSDFTISSCQFESNRSDSDDTDGWHGVGGAIYARNNSLAINNTSFTSNVASTLGGGIDADDGCSITLSGCQFIGNTSGAIGGAARLGDGDNSNTIDNCQFLTNVSSSGGGLVIERFDPTISNCDFHGNTANGTSLGDDGRGGGLFTNDCSALLMNCVVSDNSATGPGGGIFVNTDTGPITLESTTACGNTPDQISGSYILQGNGNYIEDSCDADGYSRWTNASGGSFHEPGNWSTSAVPNSNTTAVLDLDNSYIITFDADAQTANLVTRNGNATLKMGVYTYSAANDENEMIIGESYDTTATLNIADGELVVGESNDTGRLILGYDNGATGALNLTGLSARLSVGQLQIGDRGTGLLSMANGGIASINRISLGNALGSNGQLTLSGNSILNCGIELSINYGTVLLDSDAELRFDNPDGPMNIYKGGTIAGDGSISGYLVNRGIIAPDASGTALRITGDFRNRGILRTTITGSAHSRIEVLYEDDSNWDGEARLAGGLLVELQDGFIPDIGSEFTSLSADDRVRDKFDVALMPDLGDDRYMKVRYPGSGPRGSEETVDLVVVGFDDSLGFDDPDTVGLNGQPEAMTVADFDNDGDDDIAVSTPGLVTVFFNANGNFNSSTSIDTGAVTVVDLDAGDFNGDSWMDLAGANGESDSITIIVNDPAGTFMTAEDHPVDPGSTPRGIAAADFNNDDRDDVAISCSGDGMIRVWRSIASGGARGFGFNQDVEVPGGDVPSGIDPGQVEEDKDLDRIDLVVALAGDDNVIILGNTSPQGGVLSFDVSNPYEVGQAPRSVAVANLDGSPDDAESDQYNDIVTANPGDGTISILLHEDIPQADFLATVDLPVGENARSVSLADLDGDGDQDIALIADNTDGSGSTLFVLRNDSNLTGYDQLLIAPAEEFQIQGIPILVDRGDLDSDGTPDLVTINESGTGLRGLPGTLGLVQSNPTPRGACCTIDSCSIETSEFCVAGGGTWLGADTACDSGPCATGACCVGVSCLEIIETECQSLAGDWIGADELCDSTTCSPCEGDSNGDGFVNIDDLLLTINFWGEDAEFGDCDGDGDADIDDMLIVISNWGACP